MLSSLHGCPQRPLFFFWALHIVHAPLQVRENGPFSHLCIKMISLPRQARDKHRENSKKDRFVAGDKQPFPTFALLSVPSLS
jgi:hypothetical protein